MIARTLLAGLAIGVLVVQIGCHHCSSCRRGGPTPAIVAAPPPCSTCAPGAPPPGAFAVPPPPAPVGTQAFSPPVNSVAPLNTYPSRY